MEEERVYRDEALFLPLDQKPPKQNVSEELVRTTSTLYK